MTSEARPSAVAVYCGSSPGKQPAYQNAAKSLAHALVRSQRPLVYGGGSKGIMGVVSGEVVRLGGKVTGVIPYAMVAAGGENEKTANGLANGSHIIVDSMHLRKVEMAKRVGGFVGLPGGFGTFEELFEVTTWTQLGIHNKPVILTNVLGFFNPFRELIRNGIREGFILPKNEQFVIFVDGPQDISEHESFDWGSAVVSILDSWKAVDWEGFGYDWTLKPDGDASSSGSTLDRT
ncbi:hypothetical protein BD410DRAFT_819006 [Rickenella mellea]|uniref:Lysine decarboxylase n=1 Tax=Rickenella mellea TaxID=50990 RepID=A0A4Y7QK82_9AGAM|nr:hypothetical protein BD410DRAFT_819006 [Rickenella mellea]